MSRTRLTDMNGTDLAGTVLNFLQSLEQTKIISKLYDGTVHIQTIGSPVRIVNVTVRVSESQKDALDLLETTGETVNVIRRDKIYKGLIRDTVNWKESIPRRVYEGTLTLLVSEVIE